MLAVYIPDVSFSLSAAGDLVKIGLAAAGSMMLPTSIVWLRGRGK